MSSLKIVWGPEDRDYLGRRFRKGLWLYRRPWPATPSLFQHSLIQLLGRVNRDSLGDCPAETVLLRDIAWERALPNFLSVKAVFLRLLEEGVCEDGVSRALGWNRCVWDADRQYWRRLDAGPDELASLAYRHAEAITEDVKGRRVVGFDLLAHY